MMRVAAQAFLSHWRRQPVQLLILLAGLALATGLWSAVQAINATARSSYAEAAAQLGADARPVLTMRDGSDVPMATLARLRRAGWAVSPVLEGRHRLGGQTLRLMGVDVLSFPHLPELDDPTRAPPLNDLLGLPGLGLAAPETIGTLDPRATTLRLREAPRLPPGVVVTDISVAARLLKRSDGASRLLLLSPPPRGDALEPQGAALDQIAPELVRTAPDSAAETNRMTDSFHLNLTAFGLLAFAVGLFIVQGAGGLAFEQRRATLRSLRALGVSMRTLAALVLAELVLLALLAGLIGLALGYLVAAALLPDVAASLRGLYDAPVAGALQLRPGWFASGLGMALLGALLAGTQGLWRLHSLPMLSATGAQPWARAATRQAWLLALAGLGLALGGGAWIWLGSGLLAGFACLAGLMLGAALILPLLLSFALRVAARFARQPVSQWIWADMRAQLPGLSLALMALLLALATNIGVGTMVKSFRLTFTGWLDQRLVSELYVTARNDAQGAELAAWVAPRVEAVLPIRHAEGRIAGQPATLYGVVDHATYRDNWPLLSALPRVWPRLSRGEVVLINEQLARRAGLSPGDPVTLAPGWTRPVGAVYSDYGNPSAQAITALPDLLARFPDIPNRRFGLRLQHEDVPALTRALHERFDLDSRAVIDQARVKAASLTIFDKTFVVTAALNVLTLAVAGFAIFTSLLSLWTLRLPHLAPVWALGLTRARLARLELMRSVMLSALTALLALPLGLGLAWFLLAVINVEAFGWRLPLVLFPLDWLKLGLLAIAAGALAALLPALRLTRLPPASLLKVFANER